MDSTPLQKKELWGYSGKSHSQEHGSGQMGKFRVRRDLLKDLKGILDCQKRWRQEELREVKGSKFKLKSPPK